jgi:hypothetical protein
MIEKLQNVYGIEPVSEFQFFNGGSILKMKTKGWLTMLSVGVHVLHAQSVDW